MSMTMESALVRTRSRLVERLSLDLSRIRRGEGPTPEELEAAPLIERWAIVPRLGTSLRGSVSGLPGLTTTTELFVLDPEAGYARCFSRFYRLGAKE